MADYPYRIRRSQRKTIAIRILPDGTVEVRCPVTTSPSTIETILTTHHTWIEKKRRELMTIPRFHGLLTAKNPLFYMGRPYPIADTPSEQVTWDGERFFLPEASPHRLRTLLETWYKSRALALFEERANFYATRYGFVYRGIRLSSASKRYGSCSARNTISLTWKLILLPVELIDYVIVHELVHTREKHHQKTFWKTVETILPDYKIREQTLKRLPLTTYWF